MNVDYIQLGKAVEVMAALPDQSLDAVITDPAYGATDLWWDVRPDLPELWEQLKRIIKPNGAIVMTSIQPFTSMLVCSNLDMFRHEWVWDKSVPTNWLNANRMPLRVHENVTVFSVQQVNYYPQMSVNERIRKYARVGTTDVYNTHDRLAKEYTNKRYPTTILDFPHQPIKLERATQKDLRLMEYLVATYTQPGDLILDCYAGSGTTLVASANLGRHYIGVDHDPDAIELANQRLARPYQARLISV